MSGCLLVVVVMANFIGLHAGGRNFSHCARKTLDPDQLSKKGHTRGHAAEPMNNMRNLPGDRSWTGPLGSCPDEMIEMPVIPHAPPASAMPRASMSSPLRGHCDQTFRCVARRHG